MILKAKIAAALLLASCVPATALHAQTTMAPPLSSTLRTQDEAFEKWMKDNNIPGLVWGVVIDGKLVHVKALGVQNIGEVQKPVSADTGFRIASMSKAFTGYAILKLRDAGKLRLDDKAAKFIPEIKGWAGDITVADLLHHTAGFVTDDPWGDRQQVMPEAEFTKLLKAGVPRTAPRGTRYEYSNMGFAMLGRIVSNVSGRDYASYVGQHVFKPLGMNATSYEIADVPVSIRAIGYRWENNAWAEEPTMKHGAFGAMGGITTTANDYAKWVGYLLSGWPAAEGDAKGKQTVRAMQYGGGITHRRTRPGKDGANCRISGVYAAGLVAADDCILGPVLFHGGGFPGYGSHMLLIPDLGVGVFALSNRTYAGPSGPVWDAATALFYGGYVPARIMPTSQQLADAYEAAMAMWRDGSVAGQQTRLAMNFLMDRSIENWEKRLAEYKEKAGDCDMSTPIVPSGKLSGRFSWTCSKGKVSGNLLLAPYESAQIQTIGWTVTE
jgi:serine-type D-Ala-D-Ala carboxypeptidase/endopeptidase